MQANKDRHDLPITLSDVYAARERLRGVIHPTPLQSCQSLGEQAGVMTWLKPECLQRTGSFKFRGAYNKIASLDDEARSRGVITYSSGNHAQAVACAAQTFGVRAVVVMPEDAVASKVVATRGYGAEVHFAGLDSLARQARALELQEQYGYAMVPPFDDPAIVAGQATVGLEIVEELPDVAFIVVPCGGGGLLSGVALAARLLRPYIEVIGIEPAGAADAQASLAAGAIIEGDSQTICDGLRVKRVGELNFRLIQEYVSSITTVADEAVLDAVRFLALRAKLVVEPSGAVGAAALLTGEITATCIGQNVVVVLSGGNIEASLLASILVR